MPGQDEVFGLVLPRDMKVGARFLDSALITSRRTQEDVSNYIRDKVAASHVEIGASRTVFPRVRIHGAKTDDIFRIEVIGGKQGTRVWIYREVPRPKPTLPPNATDADRWKAAGRNPDGTQADRLKQY